ncbi:MAG: DegQ family serine endoprotease [Gammaproteobacteria bacterium]|nr:DegQ family serine endoprotease [Gammaproteobacteria bacterium]MBT8134782.1 DegQ family serine endoprotease [Gammaproteobacteria bacterium]NNJ49122.1 DegQ family serine endoprotease [Gammaproteobacteria bacterium]
MSLVKPFFVSTVLIISAFTTNVFAVIPAYVEGQALPSLAPMIEKTRPAVVNIATRGSVNIQNHPLLNDPLFKRFFKGFENMPQRKEVKSLGSGVIIDADAGYIVTNHHVIEGADEIAVTLHDGQQLEAKVVGSDPEADVAILKVEQDDLELTHIPFADSSEIKVGDFAVAIGNPFGLGQTVTSGIISALGRTGLGIEGYEDFIQTDASINPGNSGGALVNLRGELIGINTAILASGGAGNVGIGFAIPINMVRELTDQLIEYGEVRRGMLGVIMQNLTPELARAFGLDMHQGVVISQVVENSAAEKAELKAGDVVSEINGVPVKSASSMRNMVGLMRVGAKMDIKVIRDGDEKILTAYIEDEVEQSLEGEKLNARLAGAVIESHDDNGNQFLVMSDVSRGSPAWNARLRKGDLILSVNRAPVKSLSDIKKMVKPNDEQILFNVQRGQTALFILIQ